jgi:D-alanyl-lipoteichoic acid acyltransferase DltB (MBOAT superfamily)
MSVSDILVLILAALALGQLKRFKGLALLASSAFAIYWLQPSYGHGGLAFWLPSITIGMIILMWGITTTGEARNLKKNLPALAILVFIITLVDLNRYFNLATILPVSNPRIIWVLLFLAAICAGLLAVLRWPHLAESGISISIFATIAIFILLKIPSLAETLADRLSITPTGDSDVPFTLNWLGFSYTAFRLLHTLRDRQNGRLPALTLEEYANYVLFFPAFTAGPIDRVERFQKELQSPIHLDSAGWLDAGTRIFTGLAKKFVIADMLALISLNDTLAGQVQTPLWGWFFLYVYSLRIYFDFSGYTDIAIGMARLLGIRLPENFASPYLKPNLTQFWNCWHMTLTQWFRAYVFNPLTRALRTAKHPIPAAVIIFITQLTTMLLIGLWHGITWNFVLWGLWHGLGLFIHNRWAEWVRASSPARIQQFLAAPIMKFAGIFLTFNFVSIGWLFFCISTPQTSWMMLLKLFGAR